MNTLANKIIIYDGNCYLCRSGAMLTFKYSSLSEENLSPYDTLDARLKSKVALTSFQNEMAVVDRGEGRTIYGLEGILYVLGTKYNVFNRIKPGSFIFRFLNLFYRIIAYNRYILFPIHSKIKCSCQPPLNIRFRLLLFACCIAVSIMISLILGYSIGRHLPVSPGTVIPGTLVAVSTGWILQVLLATIYLKGEQLYDYLGNLGVIMLTGVLVLAPALAGSFLQPRIYFPLLIINVLASCITMLRMHHKRTGLLGLKTTWDYSLFTLLISSAYFTIYFYTID